VQKHNLPPKMLVIHRFTQGMVTNYKGIKLRPEVQVVMDMDGWGFAAKKVNTYKQFVYREPVQFTGFKIFYKNDTKESGAKEMQPADVLKLVPKPVYIQYQ
jgi:V8-like Glu-specific endopeptidase